jgi:hypothetical protein
LARSQRAGVEGSTPYALRQSFASLLLHVEPLAWRSTRPVAVVGDYSEELSVSEGGPVWLAGSRSGPEAAQ